MSLGKCIRSKRLQLRPEFLHCSPVSINGFYGSLNKLTLKLGEYFWNLFPDTLPQGVSLTPCKATHIFTYLHDLFLVDNDPIGSFKGRLHCRMYIANRFFAPLTGYKII